MEKCKNYELFAKRLNKAMSKNKLRQVDLVKLTGISKATISQYLSGEFKPKDSYLKKLSEVLNVNELWLEGYDVPMDIFDQYTFDLSKSEIFVDPLSKAIKSAEEANNALCHENINKFISINYNERFNILQEIIKNSVSCDIDGMRIINEFSEFIMNKYPINTNTSNKKPAK